MSSIEEKTNKLASTTKEYLRSEMSIALEDYKLLEEMNRVTTKKYAKMATQCKEIAESQSRLKSKYDTLGGYFAQIDKLEKKINNLEEMAYAIDSYTKKLESQFKKLDS